LFDFEGAEVEAKASTKSYKSLIVTYSLKQVLHLASALIFVFCVMLCAPYASIDYETLSSNE
jgi:hypothetical protein